MTETTTLRPEPKLTLEQYRERNAELEVAHGRKFTDLDDRVADKLRRSLPRYIEEQRAHIDEDQRLARCRERVDDPRIELENLLYLNGDIDKHSAVHGTPSLVTVTAGELCGKHLGWTVHGLQYRDKNKTSRPIRKGSFTVDTIHHLKNGAILINGSYPYLRPDTVLAVMSKA